MTHCSECKQHTVVPIVTLRSFVFGGKKIKIEAELSHCNNCHHETISMDQLKKISELCKNKYKEE